MLVAPIVMADNVDYSATVRTGQSTSVTASDGAFGEILQNTAKTITDSVNLSNSGDWDANVEAKFTTNVSSIYGLVNGTNIIGGGNFTLGPTGSLVSLNNDGTDVQVATVNASEDKNLDAKLTVPSGQTAAIYNGTVLLTFSNV
ncbi:MAG: hypothetical protein ACE5J9_00740 [Methanosarcinales archaeon]